MRELWKTFHLPALRAPTLAVPVMLVVGCGMNVSHIRGGSETYKPRTRSPEVFQTTPERDYTTVGKVFAHPAVYSSSGTTPEECVAALQKESVKLGADAIVVANLRMASVGTVNGGQFSCEATAVRWSD